MRAATIVCIASGLSLTAADVLHCRGRAHVLAVNDCYRIASFADAMYACDPEWWRATSLGCDRPNHALSKAILRPGAKRYTQNKGAAELWDLDYIESLDGVGLCTTPNVIHQGETSGFQAVNLAFHLVRNVPGARRIILLGYDMRGRGHWFGDHPAELYDARDFSDALRYFGPLARDLASEGIDVINASRMTGLTCFRRASIEEALS